MPNREIAMIFFNIATMLEMSGGNPYRITAYRRTAQALLWLPDEVTTLLTRGEEIAIPFLGDRLRRKIGLLASEGRLAVYEELLAEQHPVVQSLMQVAGVGPKTAMRLFTELQITSPEALLFAARRGRIKTLFGFGERSERRLEAAAAALLPGDEPPTGPRDPVSLTSSHGADNTATAA